MKPNRKESKLSLFVSYDMITKVQGGEMKMETSEKDAAFTMIYPSTQTACINIY